MKRIILKLWPDSGRNYIRIDRGTHPEVDLVLRDFPFIRYHSTEAFYFLPYTKANMHELFTYLNGEGWYVDYSDLRSMPLREGIQPMEKPDSERVIVTEQDRLQDFLRWMSQQRYSENTINTYIGLLQVFFNFHEKKAPEAIGIGDIERFNTEYILARGYSRVFQNQLISALKLFYMRYHDRLLDITNLERPRKARKLPEVLSKEEVVELLTAIRNSKHKFLLSLIYSCGLRIGEALQLRLTDLDTQRKFLHIRHGKGAKDRFIPLSDRTIEKLQEYLRTYRPKDYLIEGRDGQAYTASSARQVLQRALAGTSITKRITLHTLRHSYATHLLENGTDIRYIQELLGHCDPKTTMIYTHVSTSSLQKIRNPFDELDL